MSDPTKTRGRQPVPRPNSARDAISAVKISERLTAEIDVWAEVRGMVRSDAICQLIELGLNVGPTDDFPSRAPSNNPVELEDLAVKQINQLLDPALPNEERERRIRRLTEGPPEFSTERIDLPKPRK